MKSKAIVCAITALSMGFSGLAIGQNDKEQRTERVMPRSERGTAVPQDRGRHNDRQVERYRGREHDRAWRDQDRREWRYREVPRAYYREGAGPRYRFYRGGHLPYEYRSRQYVVDDWRDHHLRRPPRGYHWVQAGPDYLLVAIATGVIATILLNQ